MSTPRIACCVVTFNRKKELEPCLQSLISQTYPFDRLIVFNSASTDGTDLFLQEWQKKEKKLEVINHSENIGGAGGFEWLVRLFHKEYDYLYLIDDDVVLAPDALAQLINSAEFKQEKWGFLASLVLDFETHQISPMNLPNLVDRTIPLDSVAKQEKIAIKTGSFVGMFLNSKAAKQVGFPLKQFFIYGDDYEYSLRISKQYPCYLIPASLVYHKGKSLAFADTPISGLWKHYYATRNLFYTYKVHRNLGLYFGDRALVLIRAILKHTYKSGPYIAVIIRGIWHGFFFRPKPNS